MHWTTILKDLIKENNFKGTWQEAIKELYVPFKQIQGGALKKKKTKKTDSVIPITEKAYNAIIQFNMFLEIVRTMEEYLDRIDDGPLKQKLLKDKLFIEKNLKKYFNKNVNEMKGGSFTSKVSSIIKGLQSGARGIGHITRFLAYTLPHFVAKIIK